MGPHAPCWLDATYFTGCCYADSGVLDHPNAIACALKHIQHLVGLHRDLVDFAFYSDDVHVLISNPTCTSSNPSAYTWDTCASQLFNPPFVHSVDFTPDGRYLAAGLGDSGVVVFDAKTRAPVGRFDGHSAPVSQVRV